MNNEIKAIVSKITPVRRLIKSEESVLIKTGFEAENVYDVTVLFYVEDKKNGDYGFEKKYVGFYDDNQGLHFIDSLTNAEVLPLNVGTYVNITCDENGKIMSVNPTADEPPLVIENKFHKL